MAESVNKAELIDRALQKPQTLDVGAGNRFREAGRQGRAGPGGTAPKIQPLAVCSGIDSPPSEPSKGTVITSGITTCIVVTPKLPRPAFRPKPVPCRRLGKKVEMLDIDEAKLPPPTPHHKAINWNDHRGHSGCCSTMPVPMAGARSVAMASTCWASRSAAQQACSA